MKMLVFKISGLFAGALLLAAITTGCVVSAPYGGAYAGVYGEYPSTYYGGYYNGGAYYPVYPRYEYWHGHYYHHHDDWDRGHFYGGHAYGHGSVRVRGHGDGHEHH